MGTSIPSWVGDPSFDRLTQLTFCGCKSTHLPTLAHLRSLEKLYVKRMNDVETLDFELLAPTSSFLGIAFPSLEVLKFHDMQGWQRWSTIGGDGTTRSFPRLREISLKRCPKLAEVSIGLIPSLRVLHIEECSEAVLTSMVCVSSSLVILKMLNVKGLAQLHREDLMHLGAVEELYIEKCDELRYLWEPELEACKILASFRKLEVWNCKKLVSLGEKHATLESIKEVKFMNCDTLESFNCSNSVERLEINCCHLMISLTLSTVQELPSSLTESIINDCDNTEHISETGSGLLPQFCLRSLVIDNCENLKAFPHEYFQSLKSLKQLSIYDCPSLDYAFPCGLWPPNLNRLTIGCLKKPMSVWGHQDFPPSLVELELYGQNSGVVSFVVEDVRNSTTSSSFLLPPSLASLSLSGFTDVDSLSEVIQHLACLKFLKIGACPYLRDLPETTSIPSSLTVKVSW